MMLCSKFFGETRSNTFHPLQIRKTNIIKFFPSIFEAYYSHSSIFTVKKCKSTNNYSITDFEDPLESPKLGLPIPRFKMSPITIIKKFFENIVAMIVAEWVVESY
jgi:hypothetical protein